MATRSATATAADTTTNTTADAVPDATTDAWGDIEITTPDTATKVLDIPESLMKLAKDIQTARTKDIITEGWSAERLKDFQRYMKGAAEKLGFRVRMMATQNRGRTAIRVTVMKPNPNQPVSAPIVAPEPAAK